MNYTLHQIQVFLKIVEFKSITRASKALNLTQPAVSIQLGNFQEQFEIPLTEVIGRQLFVTEFGKKIAELGAEIVSQMELINYQTRAFKGMVTGHLKIAVVSTGIYVMPYLLNDFLAGNPGIDLQMEVTNKSSVIRSITENEMDLGLVSILPDRIKLDEEILLENPLFLVGNKALPEINSLNTAEIFSRYPIIFREPGSATRAIQENYFQQSDVLVKNKIQLTSNEAVKQAVIAGLGLSIMPLIGMRNELKTGDLTLILPVRSELSSRWRLVWLKKKKLSPVSVAYLNFLKDNKDRIWRGHFSWLKTNGIKS